MSNGNGNGNGNGEVKKLANLKHAFKDEATQLETDLRTKFEQELEAAEKDLKDKYLDQVVDWFYGNGFNGKPPQPAEEPEPEEEVENVPKPPGDTPDTVPCTNCDANLIEGDKFCSQCAAPVEEPEPASAPVVSSAGRLVTRRVRQPTNDERFRSWARTQHR